MLKKDLLDINSLTKEDILSILEEGERMREIGRASCRERV